MTECILQVETYDDLINAVACVLEDVASSIVNFRMMLRNKCPWALYVSRATGRRWATFIARSKFKGYHLRFEGERAICTNLETGKQYTVSLDWCSCARFEFSQSDESVNKPCCQHIKVLREYGERFAYEDAIAAETPSSPEPEAQRLSIDSTDCPKGYGLQKSDRSELPEYRVFFKEPTAMGYKKRFIGHISETSEGTGILAKTPRAYVGTEFSTTADAIGYLARHAGFKLETGIKPHQGLRPSPELAHTSV